MPRFVSWLGKAIDELPQAKATAEQWLAQLRKSPLVNNEEIVDRGLEDMFQYSLPQGSVSKEQLKGALEDYPMPQAPWQFDESYANWATPGIENYRERIIADPQWDRRSVSTAHFPDVEGYQYHTRGGFLDDPNLGQGYILDEVQADTMRQAKGRFDPNAMNVPREILSTDDILKARTQALRGIDRQYGWDLYSEADELLYNPENAAPPRNIEAGLAQLEESGISPDYFDDLRGYQDMAIKQKTNFNLPGKKSWPWHGASHGLMEATRTASDFLAWPSSEVQYKRYFQRGPEYYKGLLGDDAPRNPRAQAEAKQALNSLDMYQNLYDKELVNNKRWEQLGLKPELVDLKGPEEVRPITGGGLGKRARELGKYWVVKLTPETRAKLEESGIPYYVMGGAAVLGQADAGALD